MRALATVALVALFGGCSLDLGYAVAIEVAVSSAISDEALATVTALDFRVEGAHETRARHRPSSALTADRTERIVYRPLTDATGSVVIHVIAEADAQQLIGAGETTVVLVPGETVSATVTLEPLGPDADLAVPSDGPTPHDMPVVDQAGIPAILPLATTACPGDVVRFKVDRPVDATMVEGMGSVSPIDDETFDVTAPGDPGVFHVRMSPKTGAPSADATLTVACLQLLAGAPLTPGALDAVGGAARFNNPAGLALAPSGALLVADTDNQLIRQIDPLTGQVTTLVGQAGQAAGYTEGTGTAAKLDQPRGLASDGADAVYFASGCRVRKLALSTKTTSFVAGGSNCPTTDGDATTARFDIPKNLVHVAGTLYATEWNSYTVRKIALSPSVQVTTLAGTAGAIGYADDQGSAARFRGPWGIAFTGGKLWVADRDSDTLRTVDPVTAVVATAVGAYVVGSQPMDATGLAARFGDPNFVSVDGNRLLVTEPYYGIVRIVDLGTLAVTTLVGDSSATGAAAETKLGPLPSAKLYHPWAAVRLDAHRIAMTSQHAIVIALIP